MPEVFIWLWFQTVLFLLTENGMDGLAEAAGMHVDTHASTLQHSTVLCSSGKLAPLGRMLM